MKKNTVILVLFLILAVIQASVPLYMVWRWENILAAGHPTYWATAPVDPYDVLKGRYVDLAFKETKGPPAPNEPLPRTGDTVYVAVGEQNSRAVIRSVGASPPASGPYVAARVSWVENNHTVHVVLPFKRYYLREDLAPMAEEAYRQSAGKDGVALVRLKDGSGVIEELFIGGRPLKEYLRDEAAGRTN